MQMFDNFDNQSPDYIPNNMFPKIPVRAICLDNDTIKPIYRNCKLVGYEWDWGDKVKMEIKNQIRICIPTDSIYTYNNEDPTTETGGIIGQKYYNLSALKSFTLQSIVSGDFIWVQDDEFTFIDNQGIGLEVPILLKEDEQVVVQLFNFRKEMIRCDIFYVPDFTWSLTPEESLKLVPGIYYMNIHLETMKEDPEDPEKKISTNLRLTNAYEIVVKGF